MDLVIEQKCDLHPEVGSLSTVILSMSAGLCFLVADTARFLMTSTVISSLTRVTIHCCRLDQLDRLLENWETTAQSVSDRLGIVWPNKLEKVATEVAKILRPRHRHHRYTDDPAPLPLGSLTTRAWQAAQQALNGDESAARALFDDIRKT